jgi:putative transposase
MLHSHLRRLERIWIDNPIYFITTCTANRKKLLANEKAAAIIFEELKAARERHGWHIGMYVVMPDHVHFFCFAADNAKRLSYFMASWKQWTSKRMKKELGIEGSIWQGEFFDHVLRNEASYAEKKEYVYHNPVRAGLVQHPADWQWQGEIEIL